MQRRVPARLSCSFHRTPRHGASRRGFASEATSASTPGPEPELYDVVCVGGGPAGLSLLTGLRSSPATSHLKMALIDGLDLDKGKMRNPSPESYSNRCSSLTPASVSYLKEIGAWRHIHTERVQPYQEMQVWDGVTASRISFDSNPSHMSTIATMVENPNITTALLTRLTSLSPSTAIFSPSRVASIALGASTPKLDLSSWPVVTLADGRRLAARLLVGADGANSPVRTFAGIESRGWDYDAVGVVATLKLEGLGRGGGGHKVAYQRFLPSGPIAMLPLPGDMATLVWSTTRKRSTILKGLGTGSGFAHMVNAGFRLEAVDIEYLHQVAGEKGVAAEAEIADEVAWRETHTRWDESKVPMRVVGVQNSSIASFPLRMRHADTYTGERVALVGDAAHTIHPLAGQGLNQGQGDAAALAHTIARAVEQGQDIGSLLALEPYTSERYLANNAMLGVVDKLHKLYRVQSGPLVPLRSWGLSAVDSFGWVKGWLIGRAAGI